MGPPLSRGSVIFHLSLSFTRILWFDPRREHSFVPTVRALCRRAQWPSRTALLQRRRRLVLDGREHGGMLRRSGYGSTDDPRGACLVCEGNPAPHACNRLGPRDPDHEAVIRFYGQGSEAAVPFSQRHIAAIAVFGLPPPRIVIDKPVAAARLSCRTLYVLSCSRVLFRPPAATRRPRASRRS